MSALLAAANSRLPPEPLRDISEIAASIGEVAYRWQIDDDALSWSVNAGGVLNITDMAKVANGRAFARLLVGGQSPREAVLNCPLSDHGAGVPYQVQYAIDAGDAVTPFWVEDTGRWFAGTDGRPGRAQGIIRVIDERDARHDRLAWLARFDELTHEMNRRSLTEILAAALDEAKKFRSAFGFLVVSVDDLARVNEAYGFAAGDEVIAACAKRLRAKMRGRDHLGRLSGNKFGIVLKECDPNDLATAAERFLVAVRDDVVRTTVGSIAITASVGGVMVPRHAETVHDVLSRAHEALSAGKLRRRGAVEMFRPNGERDARRRDNIKATEEIVGALNERRILAAFEPVVEAGSRQVAFHECLMRIRRADGTLALANDIVPVAERLGLVRLVDCRMLELVIDEMTAQSGLRLSLNVSPSSINDGTWWSSLVAALTSHRDIAARLTIEITESAAIRDLDEACAFVTRLKDMGCRIAIDDFGAGYTSFRNIRRLGVDLVKIDGSFVKGLAASADDRVFARMLIELARQLGLATVAEWVQDEAAAAMLAGWGCDYLQGALIGHDGIAPPWRAAASDDTATGAARRRGTPAAS